MPRPQDRLFLENEVPRREQMVVRHRHLELEVRDAVAVCIDLDQPHVAGDILNPKLAGMAVEGGAAEEAEMAGATEVDLVAGRKIQDLIERSRGRFREALVAERVGAR